MEKSTLCMDSVAWREVGEEPTEEFWEPNKTCPRNGEIRWARIDHDFQIPVGERIWMLYQSGISFVNGWPEPLEEIESSLIIEVEILEQTPLKKIENSIFVDYWARVRCVRAIFLKDVVRTFPDSRPISWPRENAEIQIFSTSNFNYHHLITQEVNDWFVTTNSKPERIILRGKQISCFQEGIEICNCIFNRKEWPHTIWELNQTNTTKKKRRRKSKN